MSVAELRTNKRLFMVVRETEFHIFCRYPSPKPVYAELSDFAQDFEELYVQGYRFCGAGFNSLVFEKAGPAKQVTIHSDGRVDVPLS